MLKRDARHVADVYSARSEMLLNSLFHKTDVVEAIVLANNGELSQSVFENVAKSLFDGDGIRQYSICQVVLLNIAIRFKVMKL
mgnify:FL=1